MELEDEGGDHLAQVVREQPLESLITHEIDGVPLLHALIRSNNRTLLLHALKRGVDPSHAGGKPATTALHVALSCKGQGSALDGLMDGAAPMSRPARRTRSQQAHTRASDAHRPPMGFDMMGGPSMPSGGVVGMLLNFRAYPNQVDSNGDSPLHLACRNRDLATAILLVDNHADINLVNAVGKTSVELAHQATEGAAMGGEGAPSLQQAVEERLTKLHRFLGAAEAGETREVSESLRTSMLANATDEDGMTAMHFAVRENQVDVVQALLEFNGNPNHVHAGGVTPLQIACKDIPEGDEAISRRLDVIEMMAGACLVLDLPDKGGNTALHEACRIGFLEAASILVDAGASTTVANNAGKVPLALISEDGAAAASALAAAHEQRAERKARMMDVDTSSKGPPLKRSQSRESKETCAAKLRSMGYSATDARLAVEKAASTDPNVCVAWLEQSKEQKKGAAKPAAPSHPTKKKKTSNSDTEDSDSDSESESESDHLWDPDEDEEMDDAPAITVSSPPLGEPFISYHSDRLLAQRDAMVTEACEVLELSPEIVVPMLLRAKWNKEALIQSFYADGSDSVLHRAGVKVGVASVNTNPPPGTTCPIFASEKCLGFQSDANATSGGLTALACGHWICNECWREYLVDKIGSNDLLNLRCFLCTVPTHQEAAAAKSKPGYVIPDTMVQELVGAELYAKYVRFVAKNYAETNPSIKWCPEPDCQCVVDGANSGYICNVANEYAPTVACDSGHRFCFNCNYKAHAPATCQMVKEWEKRNADQGGDETMIWVQLNSSPCPKCGVAIQKNQGCNHMTCRPPVGCGFDYCWICKSKWGECDYYSCNKFKAGDAPKDEKDASLKEKANQLEKYLFYWKRYKAQDISDKFQAELEVKLNATIEEIHESSTDPTALSLCEKIKEALEQLYHCRNGLKWAFVYAFSVPDTTEAEGNHKELFEQWLSLLAQVSDQLMEELEKPPEEMSLALLSDQVAVAKKNFSNLEAQANLDLN